VDLDGCGWSSRAARLAVSGQGDPRDNGYDAGGERIGQRGHLRRVQPRVPRPPRQSAVLPACHTTRRDTMRCDTI